MKIISADNLNVIIPKGVEGFSDNNSFFTDEISKVTAYCSKTALSIEINIDFTLNKIMNITCDSRLANGKCISANGPRDSDGNLTLCDI